jgi:sensory rhodopsin
MNGLTHVAALLGVVGLLAGLGVGVVLLRSDYEGRFAPLLVIPGFAAFSYLLMAFGIGNVVVEGYALPIPRYVDWLVTTPVLVGYVGYVAGADRRAIGAVAGADMLMILLGLGASLTATPLRWVLFALSAGCHLALLYVLYGVFPGTAAEQSLARRQLFGVLKNHVGLLWLAYPLVWLAGPAGLGYVSALGIALVITYLDVVAKTPYVYFVWAYRRGFDGDDDGPRPASGTGPDADVPAASAD